MRGPVVVVRRKGGKQEKYDPQSITIFAPKGDGQPTNSVKLRREAPRVEGVQLLLASQTVPAKMPETVTTADFAAMLDNIENPQTQSPRRTVYQTRLQHRRG